MATVAQLINKKDSFTRIQEEREQELRRHREEQRAAAAQRDAERARRERIKADLFALFGEQNSHRREKALEGVLNRLFESEEILVREAFEVRDDDTGSTLEQIDGAIELAGRLYLVEMKWWDQPLGRGEVSSHLVRVFSRGDVEGHPDLELAVHRRRGHRLQGRLDREDHRPRRAAGDRQGAQRRPFRAGAAHCEDPRGGVAQEPARVSPRRGSRDR